jgi:hypothetical protein
MSYESGSYGLGTLWNVSNQDANPEDQHRRAASVQASEMSNMFPDGVLLSTLDHNRAFLDHSVCK